MDFCMQCMGQIYEGDKVCKQCGAHVESHFKDIHKMQKKEEEQKEKRKKKKKQKIINPSTQRTRNITAGVLCIFCAIIGIISLPIIFLFVYVPGIAYESLITASIPFLMGIISAYYIFKTISQGKVVYNKEGGVIQIKNTLFCFSFLNLIIWYIMQAIMDLLDSTSPLFIFGVLWLINALLLLGSAVLYQSYQIPEREEVEYKDYTG